MRPLFPFAALFLLFLAPATSAFASGKEPTPGQVAAGYERSKAAARQMRTRYRRARRLNADALERDIVASVLELSGHWLGTPWGLGAPQSGQPGVGKINCGTFVGTVLRDAGFNVNVRKLQRQPSQLIIRSFVGKARMKKFSRAPMPRFLAEVRSMGPGLFIIGLDFHVGLLVVEKGGGVRFIHASYETGTVVNEDAASAAPIVDSGYRVVGKILSPRNLRDFRSGRRIRVVGDW
jgi:hypothetical protein